MIIIDRKLRIPLYEQVYSQIKNEIISGKMPEGSLLVPIRAMAFELGVSKNTVDLAYKQLLSEGYIRARRGSGYFVENKDKYGISEPVKYKSGMEKMSAGTEDDGYWLYDFSFESVSSNEFEWKKWKKCLDESLYEEEYNFNGYKDCRGDIGLRQSIAKYISVTRDVKCTPEQVVICSGTLYAINMSVNVINKYKNFTGMSKKTASCDSECEDHIKNVFINKGYEICDYRDDCVKDILYVSPSHQYPLGYTMDYTMRKEYISYAATHGSFIIENDCDSEFTYGRQRIPCMQSLGIDSDRVIYVSSVSRILSPNIRLAYMVLPVKLTDIFLDMYNGYRTAVPVLHQRTLARYIDMGYMHKHIRKLLHTNEEKFEIILEYLKKLEKEGYINILGRPAGGYIAIKTTKSGKTKSLSEYAAERKIRLYEEGEYILVGYLSIEPDYMNNAALKLYETVREYSLNSI